MLRKVLLFALFGVFIFHRFGIAAGPDPNLVILYTGDSEGYVEPSGCKCNPLGGLARRASMIKDVRKKYKNVLLVDCGDSLSKKKGLPELRAKTIIEGLDLMRYDAFNLADGELLFALDFLKKVSQEAKVPFLSANIVKQTKAISLAQNFLVKEFDAFKVGILGLASPDYFNQESLAKEGISVLDPEQILRKILSEIREKVDVVVLLSHLGSDNTKELMQKVSGVDVAVAGHRPLTTGEPDVVGKTLVVQASYEGTHLGILALTLGQDGSIASYQGTKAKLSRDIPDDPEVAALIGNYKKEQKALIKAKREEERKERHRLLMEEIKEGLKMTPEEFFEREKVRNRSISPKGRQ